MLRISKIRTCSNAITSDLAYSMKTSVIVGGTAVGTWASMQRKYKIFRPGDIVVDVGALPGRIASFAAPLVDPVAYSVADDKRASALVVDGGTKLISTTISSNGVDSTSGGLVLGVDWRDPAPDAPLYPGLMLKADVASLEEDRGPLVAALLGSRHATAQQLVDVVTIDLAELPPGTNEGLVEDEDKIRRAVTKSTRLTMGALKAIEPLLRNDSRLVLNVLREAPNDECFSTLWRGVSKAYETCRVVQRAPVHVTTDKYAPSFVSVKRSGGASPKQSEQQTPKAVGDQGQFRGIEAVTIFASRRRNGAMKQSKAISMINPAGLMGMERQKYLHKTFVADKRHGGKQRGKVAQRSKRASFFKAIQPQQLQKPLPQDHWQRQASQRKEKKEKTAAMDAVKMGMVSTQEITHQRDD